MTKMYVRLLQGGFLVLAFSAVVTAAAEEEQSGSKSFTPAQIEFFEKKIRPVLVEHCHKCHSRNSKKDNGGLLLDSRAGFMKGGDSGVVVVPGKVDDSLLIDALAYSPDFVQMPPAGRLPKRIVDDFRKWVEMGAPQPADKSDSGPVPQKTINMEQGRRFWSFQPVRSRKAPKVSRPDWPRKKHDAFVLQKLDEKKLQPSAEADRRTIIRRLYIDLIGLPPTLEEIEAFENDQSPEALETLVEHLLTLPQYGERWGRHWLDIARYAEDNPTSESTCKPPRHPHPYRDWVIRAFNEDLPYDEFVRRQLAADLMEELPPSEIAALGFLGLSPVYHKEPKLSKDVISVIVADEWDERIDTITRGFLGLTVTCARCHDHKFDPIRMQDYYALAGVMASTQLVEWPLVESTRAEAERITNVQLQIVDYQLRLNYAEKMKKTAEDENRPADIYEEDVKKFKAILEKLKSEKLLDAPLVNAVRDAGLWINGDDPAWTKLDFEPHLVRDLPVFLRGSVTNHGEVVPRRFLEVVSPGNPVPFQQGSGRLELANAIVGESSSLAARVIVNRIWGWHFGTPIVATPSNFGKLGDEPSHRELLDDLAARFIENGWSMKWLHREIVLSSTYLQTALPDRSIGNVEESEDDLESIDPDNRLLSRMNRRRMEPEAWRDSVLSISGELDKTMGGPSFAWDGKTPVTRRTIYGTISRQKPANILQLFDFPDAKRHSDRRILTTTPLQQLYLLNSNFLQRHAKIVGIRAARLIGSDVEETTREVFRQVLLREPTDEEMRGALHLVQNGSEQVPSENWATLAHALFASNEFLFVD